MEREAAARVQLAQSTMRLRLAATALGLTVLLLAGTSDPTAAGALLLGYSVASVLQRYLGAIATGQVAGAVGVGMDVLFATAITALVPETGWALFAFAIGTAALRYGPLGIAAATAAAVIGYDVVLIGRGGDARAADLWPVQVLLAFGVLAAELAWVTVRLRRQHRDLGAFSLAQHDLAAATDEAGLLDRLVDHTVRGLGASGAAVERRVAGERWTTLQVRGLNVSGVTEKEARSLDVPLARDTRLRVAFPTDASPDSVAAVRDLCADAMPLLGAARERARERQERDVEGRLLRALRRIADEKTQAAVLAQAIALVQAVAGPAAIVRPADGARIVGDLDPDVATSIARDAAGPRLVGPMPDRHAGANAIAVPIGSGQTLVAIGTRRILNAADLDAFQTLAQAVATASERIAERETLIATAAGLRRRSDELEGQLRERDDAVALAVHELRNPLTSVQAYGQLMSRNLAAVQRQVTQLGGLIEDLLHTPGGPSRPLDRRPVDLFREVSDAVSRLRLSDNRADVRLSADGTGGPPIALADPGRFAQVIDNLLTNAMKFSPAGSAVDVRVVRRGDEVRVMVRDQGDGIPRGEEKRIFERYARGSQHRQNVPGLGIGLAVSRDIVRQHGGRIFAESDGPGKGSVFTVVLPAAQEASGASTEMPEGSTTR